MLPKTFMFRSSHLKQQWKGYIQRDVLPEKCFRSIREGQGGGSAGEVLLPYKSKIWVDPQNPRKPSMMAHAYNPRTGEVETIRLQGLAGQPDCLI